MPALPRPPEADAGFPAADAADTGPPTQRADAGPATPPRAAAPVPEHPLVWLVEDSPTQAALVMAQLADEYELAHFSEGHAMFEHLAVVGPPDVLLLDWLLPDLSGVEVCRAVRAQYDEAELPVLVFTADLSSSVAEALGAGANDFLRKSASARELQARMRTLARTRRLHEAARRAQATADEGRARLRRLFLQAPALVNMQRGPEHVFELAHPLMCELLGGRDPTGRPLREALPGPSGQRLLGRLDHVYATGEPFVGVEVPLGGEGEGERLFNLTYQPLRAPDGRVEGVITFGVEVTEQVSARRRAEALAAEVRAGELDLREKDERLRLALRAADVGTWDFDPASGQLRWDARSRAALGVPPGVGDAVPYATFLGAAHPDDRDRVDAAFRSALAPGGGSECDVEYRSCAPQGDLERWLAARGRAIFDAEGRPRLLGTLLDVSDRRRDEERYRFLAEASQALSPQPSEPEAVLERAVRLAVPRFAPIAVIDLADEAGGLGGPCYVAHHDPAAEGSVREWLRRHRPGGPSPALEVFRTGAARRVDAAPAALEAAAREDPHTRALLSLGPRTLLIAPLKAGGRALGVLTFASPARAFLGNDLRFVEEFALRAGVALDNARLFALARLERARAEEANRAKDEFLAAVSHELRTPLNAMLGWTHMLRAGALDEANRARALDVIERNARAQTQLIEDLLDVSRIISGKLRLRVGSVDLRAVVEAALDAVRPAAEAKRLALAFDLDPDAGPISGDADRLQQIAWNLLSNAVKFTPEGGRVTARVSRQGAHVLLRVEDSGQGIAPEFLPYVFERFRQAEAAAARRRAGLGLGLAIVKHLVEMHGGTVTAESAGEGRGAAFVVRIPPAAPREGAHAPPTPGPLALHAPAHLEGLRALVIDDEPDARDLLRSILEHCKMRVETAAGADEAFDLFRASRPDLLLSDVAMPGSDGYVLLRRVRSLPPSQGGRTPAVAVTAYARSEDRTRALLAGYNYHLPKPVDPGELIAVVANAAASLDRRAEPPSASDRPDPPHRPPGVVD